MTSISVFVFAEIIVHLSKCNGISYVLQDQALQFIKQLGQAMHSVVLERNKQSLQLIYVIGPPRTEKLHEHDFGPEDLRSLSDAVDGYSLMTYDFSSPHSPGPNAPLKWVRSTMHMLLGFSNAGAQDLAQKIFVGINFYGNDFVLSGGTCHVIYIDHSIS